MNKVWTPSSLISIMSDFEGKCCPLPFHPDPGQPTYPKAGEKIYLVSGPDCKKAGAYVSW
jgi:hypothetical protein